MQFPVAKNELSKIFVSGQEKCLLPARDQQDFSIINSRRGFGYEKHGVAGAAQRRYCRAFDTFIRHQPHDATRSNG